MNHVIQLIFSLTMYMSFTRFYDDPCRIQKQIQESTGPGRYALNVPGQGERPSFMEDPYIRMQKWGGNLMKNSINLESDLRGLTRKATRDILGVNEHAGKSVQEKMKYPVSESATEQSRATHPAWMVKDLEQRKWDILPLDPQEHTTLKFHNNLSTRILEKDYHVTKMPNINN